MMKKIITLVLALAMAVSLFTGCGKKNNAETGESDPNKLSVVTTIPRIRLGQRNSRRQG